MTKQITHYEIWIGKPHSTGYHKFATVSDRGTAIITYNDTVRRFPAQRVQLIKYETTIEQQWEPAE